MKLKYLYSSSVLIDNGVKILCDPWLAGSNHYGSWALYPPYKFKPEQFEDVDYIYISHIHQDHLDHDTLDKLNKDIPIIIHDFKEKFVFNNLKSLGFRVIELKNGIKMPLGNNTYISIVSADNCNPELCGRFLGCASVEYEYKATQIDTMSFISNDNETILNTNDCPYDLIRLVLPQILTQFKHIDLMLVGYNGAGPYPQCFKISKKDKIIGQQAKKLLGLNNAVNLIQLVKPRYYMPFAGLYTLAGKLSKLEKYRGESDFDTATKYLMNNVSSKCVLLNTNESFDITRNEVSKEYTPIDHKKKLKYIKEVLSKQKFDYELDKMPTDKELIELSKKATSRFDCYRKRINYTTDTKITINNIIKLSFNDKPSDKYLKLTLDPRLLKRILMGPKYAHWQVADGGSHLTYERNVGYERGLAYCLCYFHA